MTACCRMESSMRGSCTPSGGWAVRSTVGRRTSSRWSDRGSRDRGRLGRRGRLVPQARLEGREHGGSVLIFRLPEPQELRIPESGREGSIQLPGEPCVLRRGQESAREARGVHFGQRVAEKPRLRARRNEQRPVRFIGPPFAGERLEDWLDAIELPFL